MTRTLRDQCQQLRAEAEGLPEPVFDENMHATNWPERIHTGISELIAALHRSADVVELRECAEMLDPRRSPRIPKELRRILTHAVFDNPDGP